MFRQIDLLFAAETPWVWDAEANFERLKAENPDVVSAAAAGKRHGKGEEVGMMEAGVLPSDAESAEGERVKATEAETQMIEGR